jgi:hypothetical protein
MSENNVILVIVSHQTERVDMSRGGGMSMMTQTTKELYNNNKIGGKALNQNGAMQVIVTRKAMYKEGTEKVGHIIAARCSKNSYGPDNRMIEWALKTENFHDTEDHIEQCLLFDEFFANFMASHSYFGTTVLRKRFTCDRLGVKNATAAEFKAAFDADESAKQELGKMLNLNGYSDVVDQILKNVGVGK